MRLVRICTVSILSDNISQDLKIPAVNDTVISWFHVFSERYPLDFLDVQDRLCVQRLTRVWEISCSILSIVSWNVVRILPAPV